MADGSLTESASQSGNPYQPNRPNPCFRQPAPTYRVTHHIVKNLPLTSNKSSVLAWPALAWPGQSETFVLKSTGGFSQRDGSPCTFSSWTFIKPALRHIFICRVFIPPFFLITGAPSFGEVEGVLAEVAPVAKGARRYKRSQLLGIGRRRRVGKSGRKS